MIEADSADVDNLETSARATEPVARESAGIARARLMRERHELDQVEQQPLLDDIATYHRKAVEAGNDEAVTLLRLARLAVRCQDHTEARRTLLDVFDMLRPKPPADQRERLIEAVVLLGKEAVDEVVRRFKAAQRRK